MIFYVDHDWHFKVNKKIKCHDMRNLMQKLVIVWDAQKKRLIWRGLLGTHNICFEWLKNNKMIFKYVPLSEGIQKR